MKGRKKMCPLGKKIVIEATKRNLTMHQLAEYLGMSSYAYLYRVVYGKVGVGEKYAEAISAFIGEEVQARHRGRRSA